MRVTEVTGSKPDPEQRPKKLYRQYTGEGKNHAADYTFEQALNQVSRLRDMIDENDKANGRM